MEWKNNQIKYSPAFPQHNMLITNIIISLKFIGSAQEWKTQPFGKTKEEISCHRESY